MSSRAIVPVIGKWKVNITKTDGAVRQIEIDKVSLATSAST